MRDRERGDPLHSPRSLGEDGERLSLSRSGPVPGSHEPYSEIEVKGDTASVDVMGQSDGTTGASANAAQSLGDNALESKAHGTAAPPLTLPSTEAHLSDDVPPDCVRYRRDITEEGYSWRRIGRSLTYLIEPVYFGLKVALLVTLPLSVLAFYGPVKTHFQAGSLLAVVGTANAQLYVGQQLSSTILVFQGACWILLWGTFMNCIGVYNNESAWWGLAFTSVILVSFFPNFRSYKLMMSYGIIIMQMQHTPGGTSLLRPANVAANLIMGASFSALQSFLPFPKLVARQTDAIFARSWNQVASITHQLRGGVWSDCTYAGYAQASRAACDALGDVIADIPAKLFLITYEPFERSLYNQLRNVRLTLLRRLLVILNAACTAAEVVTSMSNTVETHLNREPVLARLRLPVDEYLDALSFTLHELGQSLEPAKTAANCRFSELLVKKDAVVHALQDGVGIVARQHPSDMDAPAFYSFVYFHLLLLMLSEELSTLGDQMTAFDPSHYKSTWRRCLEFFLLDFWNDFRNKLPGRLVLRTPEDRRSLKEGIKFACAYCVAAAFTLRLNTDHTADTYFFGMSIILGIGLPTASESIDVGIQRIAGLAFALAIGYLAEWKTQNLAQAIAIVVSGAFVGVCFRGTQRYMHVAYYASFIAPAAYGIAADKVTMISRVVDNSFAVMSYLVICAFMFPINPFRVLWNKQSVVYKTASEVITQLATVAQLPLEQEYEDLAQAKLQIASEKLTEIDTLLGQCKVWVGISAKEPVIIGKPFPTEKVGALQAVMVHLVAGLQVWLFGLQIVHRARPHPPQPAVHAMLEVLRPLLRDAEVLGRVIFQDLIDAIEVPLEWTPARSYRHLGGFMTMKTRLEAAFHVLHKNVLETQDPVRRRRAVVEALARGGDPTASPVTRSFVGTSVLSPDPRNIQGMPDDGVVDRSQTRDPRTLRPGTGAPNDSLGGGGGTGPRGLLSPHHTGAADRGTAGTDQKENSSFAPVAPVRRRSTMLLSFRAPVGNLPVDVDVTAITIVIMSVGNFISALERLLPAVSAANDFERSRLQGAVTNIAEFYQCK